jgi:hypothetical protein
MGMEGTAGTITGMELGDMEQVGIINFIIIDIFVHMAE